MPDSSGIFCFNYSASIPSNSAIILTASSREWPHMSGSGWKAPQMRGRSGRPNILQRKSSSRLTQRTPAGLPLGIPGIGELIEITVQQAAQLGRQSIFVLLSDGFLFRIGILYNGTTIPYYSNPSLPLVEHRRLHLWRGSCSSCTIALSTG